MRASPPRPRRILVAGELGVQISVPYRIGAPSVRSSAASHDDIRSYDGEIDEGFEWLERAYTERDSGLHEMLNDPFLSNLMSDRRWQPFLVRMGLADP